MLLPAGRKDDDRHLRPLADLADHLHAVDVGQAQVQNHQIRLLAGGLHHAVAAGVRFHEPIAVAAQRNPQEPPDFLLVFDHAGFSGRRWSWLSPLCPDVRHCGADRADRHTGGCLPTESKTERPLRRRGGSRRESCRRAVARCRGRSPGPGRPRRGTWNCRPDRTSRTAGSASPGGRPGPRSATSTTIESPSWRADTSMGVPAGVCRAAFSSRFTSTCCTSRSSSGTNGRSAATCVVTGWSASCRASRPSAAPITSSTGCHSLRTSNTPACKRVMSSRFATSRLSRSDSSRIEATSSRRTFGLERPAALQQRAAGPGDDRQRRAQVVRHGAQQRAAQPFRFDVHANLLGLGLQIGAFQRQRDQAGKRLQEMKLLDVDGAAPGRRESRPARPPFRATWPAADKRLPTPAAWRCPGRPFARDRAPTWPPPRRGELRTKAGGADLPRVAAVAAL